MAYPLPSPHTRSPDFDLLTLVVFLPALTTHSSPYIWPKQAELEHDYTIVNLIHIKVNYDITTTGGTSATKAGAGGESGERTSHVTRRDGEDEET